MRLGLKLAAFGIILLLPKTQLYLSNGHAPEAQTASERPIPGPVAHSMGYLKVSAEGKQAIIARRASIANVGFADTTPAAFYVLDKSTQFRGLASTRIAEEEPRR